MNNTSCLLSALFIAALAFGALFFAVPIKDENAELRAAYRKGWIEGDSSGLKECLGQGASTFEIDSLKFELIIRK